MKIKVKIKLFEIQSARCGKMGVRISEYKEIIDGEQQENEEWKLDI